jgi:single-stranded-DNA-specific exonuclease
VALGTVADLVPLDCNNRRLIAQGLKRFKKNLVPNGLKALLKISDILPEKINCSDLGFKIAPKLNAAGRLSDMSIGIRCLIEADKGKALKFAKDLEELNQRRKKIETVTREEGINLIVDEEISSKGLGIILFKENWHQGVVGLVANKVKDLTTKPTIAFAYQNKDLKLLKGSGRSIKGIHLRDVLERIAMRKPGLIIAFGGHAMAAGMTIYERNINEFKIAFNKALDEFTDKSLFSPILQSDGVLDLEKIDIESVKELMNAIWGQSFSQPIFHDEFLVHEKKPLKEKHLKLTMSQNHKHSTKHEAIWFDAPLFDSKTILVAYELNLNNWQGKEKIQLLIKHIIE